MLLSNVFLVFLVWPDHFLQVAVKAGKLSNSLFKRLDVFRQMLRGDERMKVFGVEGEKTLPETNKSGDHQLRLVVYPIIYDGFLHPRWLALGFLNHQQ